MDVVDIHQRDHNIGAYVVFIEGCPIAFTDCPALAGSGASSWIGTSYGAREVLLASGEPRSMVPDLPLGETVPSASSIQEVRVTFRLADFDRRLAALFREVYPDSTTDSMGERLAPTDDPAPSTIAGPDATPIDLWDRHIGIEAIGPAGERRYYWIEPSGAPPGLDHVGGVHWPPSVITDDPYVWAGRMVAVYRIVQDPDDGSWPSWTDQHAGGSLWWVGKLKGRGAFVSGPRGREFHLPATGVSSLLRKNLNLARPPRWIRPPEVGLVLTGDALKVSAWIEQLADLQVDDGISVVPSTFDCQTLASGNTFSGCVTKQDYATKLAAIIGTMISGSDTGGVLASTNAGYAGPVPPVDNAAWQAGDDARDVELGGDGSYVKIKCEDDSGAFDGFKLGFAIDVRIIQFWGWDIDQGDWQPAKDLSFRCPVGGTLWGENNGDEILPDKHYIGRFSTKVGNYDENGGKWVEYEAPYVDGTISIGPSGGETLSLGIDEVACEGQLAQPYVYGDQINSTNVDAAGWWLLRGERLTAAAYEAGEDPEEFVQVAFCEWIASTNGDAVAQDSTTHARLRIVRLEDPRRFGLPFDRLDEPWTSVVGGLEVAPIAVLGGNAASGGPGWRHRLIPSLLVSSGTAAFSESGGVVSVTTGDNHPSGLPDQWSGDVEVADLGLCIPKGWVDVDSWYACSERLPGGSGGALNRVTYAALGPVQAEDILRQAMSGAGWAWSWKRTEGAGVPKLGCWDPIETLTPEDIEVAITRAASAEPTSPADNGGEMWSAVVELRNDGPFDRFDFAVDRGPLDSALAYELGWESQDPGRRYRDGRIAWTVEDGGLRNPTYWLGTPSEALFTWTEAARLRFSGEFGKHYSRSSRLYRDVLDATYITRLGLGTIVLVVNASAEAPDGTIGINHLGRVVDAKIINSGGQQAIAVAVQLQPYPIDEIRVWGPCAVATEAGNWDASTSTVTIDEDHAGVGGDHVDTLGFTRPAWCTLGAGALKVRIYQSEDGVDYPSAMEATADVASVDSGTPSITLASITGTIYRDTIKRIVADTYDVQTAEWALGLLMPVTLSTGVFDGSKGYRL